MFAWSHLGAWIGLGEAPAILAALIQWVVVAALLLASFSLAYYFGTEVKQAWEWVTPGGTLGVLALIAATLGFRLYLHYGFSLSETYGMLAGVVVVLLWLYIAALSLLVGAEVNSVIEPASPAGAPPAGGTNFRRGIVPSAWPSGSPNALAAGMAGSRLTRAGSREGVCLPRGIARPLASST